MKKISPWLSYVLAIPVFVLGFFLRAQETISHNYLFLIDQGRDMLAVKGIVFDHHLTLIGPYTSLTGVFQGPLWYYLLAIPTFITRGDPWGTVVLMLLISMAVLGVVFYFSQKLFGNLAALIITFLFAVSPQAVAAATFSWNPHPMWLVVTLFIFTFYYVIQGSKRAFLFYWPLIAIGFHFETAMGVFLLVGSLIYFLLFQRKKLFSKNSLFGMFISIVFFLPQIIFDLRHDFLMTRSIMKIFGGSSQGLFVKNENKGFFTLFSDHLQELYKHFSSAFMHEGLLNWMPVIVIGFIILFLLFNVFYKFLSHKEQRFVYALLTLLGIILCLMIVYPFPLRGWFLTGFESFYLILFGLLLTRFARFKAGFILLLLFIVITLYQSAFNLDKLYYHPPDDGGGAKSHGKLAALDTVYKDAAGKPFGLLVFTPPVYTDAYDYLVWWYGSKKYHFVPYKEKKGTVYLLMEEDFSNPSSYDGWLKTIIVTGKVEFTKELSNGLILQKRTFGPQE